MYKYKAFRHTNTYNFLFNIWEKKEAHTSFPHLHWSSVVSYTRPRFQSPVYVSTYKLRFVLISFQPCRP